MLAAAFRCPSVGNVRCENNNDTSVIIKTLPRSMIHLKVPIIDFTYSDASGFNSGL